MLSIVCLKALKNGFQSEINGRGMTLGLTAPIAFASANILKTANDFDTAMNSVFAKRQKLSDQDKESLKNKARALGAIKQFTATETAQGMEKLAMAGRSFNEIMKEIEPTLDLAAAAGADFGRTSDILTDIMQGMGETDVNKTVDVLAQTMANANVDLENLFETFKDGGPLARQFGLDIKEVAAITGFLGSSGIKASKAGTAWKNMLTRLAAPTPEAQEMLDSLGVFPTVMKDGVKETRPFLEIMGDLSKSMAHLGNADQLKIMESIFGKIPIASVSVLMADIEKGSKGINKQLKLMSDKELMGAAKRMAKDMMEGLPGAIKKFKSALDELKLTISDLGLKTFFMDILVPMTNFIRKFAKANPTIIKTIMLLTALAAVVGPLLVVAGSLMLAAAGISAFIASLSAGTLAFITGTTAAISMGAVLSSLAVTVGVLAAGFAAMSAVVYYFRDEYLEALGLLTGEMNFEDTNLYSWIEGAINWIKELGREWQGVFGLISQWSNKLNVWAGGEGTILGSITSAFGGSVPTLNSGTNIFGDNTSGTPTAADIESARSMIKKSQGELVMRIEDPDKKLGLVDEGSDLVDYDQGVWTIIAGGN